MQNGIGEHSLYSYEKRYAEGRDHQFVYSYTPETLARAFMKERMEEVYTRILGNIDGSREKW